MITYGIVKELHGVDFEDALRSTVEALESEGFGVITEIDVQATLQRKLEVDFRRYVILGACNPPYAHLALKTEPLIGLLLPCNVVVSESDTGSLVAALQPRAIFGLVDNKKLEPLANTIENNLKGALEQLCERTRQSGKQ